MPSVLFVCVANSCRSQMAEAIAKSLTGGRWQVSSAGAHPSGQIHPLAVSLLTEQGMTLAGHRSKGLDEVPARTWDYVVTMGCGDACPHVPAARRLDWALPDPVAMDPEAARGVRDRIIGLVRGLIESHESAQRPAA